MLPYSMSSPAQPCLTSLYEKLDLIDELAQHLDEQLRLAENSDFDAASALEQSKSHLRLALSYLEEPSTDGEQPLKRTRTAAEEVMASNVRVVTLSPRELHVSTNSTQEPDIQVLEDEDQLD